MKRYLIFFICTVWSVAAVAQADTTQHVVPGRQNSPEQQEKPYVIMISADGFRYDYADKYKAKTLQALRAKGVEAASLVPSFPSKTFPNHYTLVTGMYPASHGLINNYFYDPQRKESYSMRERDKVEDGSWYGGVPLWVLAEQHKMLSASFYWVGSEALIQNTLPTYWYTYNEKIPFATRVETVVDWLNLPAEKRPHLITFYLSEVDHAGHMYGPDAPETAQAVQELDEQIKQLTEAVATTGLPVNYIFVSDHGMTQIDQENTLPMPAAIDTADFIVSGGGMVVELHAKDKKAIKRTYRRLKKEAKGTYQVYTKENLPAHLHYGKEDDKYQRVGDILLLTTAPKVFHFYDRKPAPGTHGYDPDAVKDMHATFYAWGPAFKEGLKVPSFKNIQVYPIVAEILGLEYTHQIDGDKSVAEQVLKQ
ncbi:putative AlkP superfamily pyrophosphatase or phosphodiesterase [Pontibacter ummariensis]|uniref:Predicted pyrophosphatase or phosphodiesterase, AlkP superfamily n=1 Tax=Pontibacter ummariensis TaxID=1610492 RepID=A0A239FPI4_9BACT|nr:ectonucleotide pyrophosphatase/phosphodiesterase [Pontibacter ummariensis]PRY11978.1 putative AlkP superfamily pyrophosphatase or phosphodiesterase [Pontibacter ummariensis]SNS58827.1 Predicted pyrophosphatase or phosphodiesterase, AlkP superfamily [Pontibacter ummariensis]